MLYLEDTSLDWALKHVSRFGDTDVFPLPFEYAAIHQDWDTIRTYLASQDLDTWAVRDQRRMLTPKQDLRVPSRHSIGSPRHNTYLCSHL